MISKDTKVVLGLAAGNVYSEVDNQRIAKWFSRKGWIYYSPRMIREKIRKLSEGGYYDDVAIVTAKILEWDNA